MNPQEEKNPIPHGLTKRIAEKAGVSANTAAKVLKNKEGVSEVMRRKVGLVAKKLIAEFKREQAKNNQLLAHATLSLAA